MRQITEGTRKVYSAEEKTPRGRSPASGPTLLPMAPGVTLELVLDTLARQQQEQEARQGGAEDLLQEVRRHGPRDHLQGRGPHNKCQGRFSNSR